MRFLIRHVLLSFKINISSTSSSYPFHSIRRCLGREVTARLVSSLIISRLDYCNSILANLPASTLAPLQRVLNAAARLVMNLGPRDLWRRSCTSFTGCQSSHDPVQTMPSRTSCNRRLIPTIYLGAGDPCRRYPGLRLAALGGQTRAWRSITEQGLSPPRELSK